MIAVFNAWRFADDVRRWLEQNGYSYREAARLHVGLNPAMLSRALTHQTLSAASVLAICWTSGLKPSEYLLFVDPAERNQPVTAFEKRETSASAVASPGGARP